VRLEVVTVGTELLLGHTLDTNAAEIAATLASVGVEVVRHTTVSDHAEAVRAAVGEALGRTGFVVTTGGLGPTRDDVTKGAVAELFGRRLVLDQAALTALEERFRRLGRWPMPALNRSQAEVPDGAVVLPNPRGTAPGLWLEDAGGRVAVLLPGVPREMRGLLIEEVLPRVAARAGAERAPVVRSRTLRTTGVAESAVAERLAGVEDAIAPLSLAYLPSVAGVDLRVTAWSLPVAEADRRLAAAVDRIREPLARDWYGDDDADLAAVVLDQLRRDGMRLAVAESCTGGLVGARLTAIPGASHTFAGAVVAYDNAVKTSQLHVPADLLAHHGAVSEPVVLAMAEGAARLFAVGAAIAVTGIAGPDGGTPAKPVGTVWLAARAGDRSRAVRRVVPGDRDEIRHRAAQAALDLLRRLASAS
jgi:nicotinamide-nucleotide amidase